MREIEAFDSSERGISIFWPKIFFAALGPILGEEHDNVKKILPP